MKRIAITGGAGQIAYSLLFRIAAGDMLGQKESIALHILELPEAIDPLKGVIMELKDCAFPLLQEIHIGSNPEELFKDIDIALLVGAKPRSPGMERKDLLRENAKIFIEQGKALEKVANENVRVLVVGNPCNTNCWIAQSFAKRINPRNFHAMTRLDENRARAQIAEKANVLVKDVSPITIWGNHSSTQVPDYLNATINMQPVKDRLELKWLQETMIPQVQNRGAEVLKARGKSSAASAAGAIIDAVHDLYHPTAPGEWFSSAVLSNGNPYGIQDDLIFSFPCRSTGPGEYEIVSGMEWDAFMQQKIKTSESELVEERSNVRNII